MRRSLLLLVLAISAVFATVGCHPAGPDVRVSWPGPVDLEVGAEVRYQEVAIGRVISISLLQPASDAPARVELGLRIDDRGVALREADVFQIESDGLLGDRYVAITPAEEPSAPLLPGAQIAGTPPLATRMRESADAAIDSLGELARRRTDDLIEAWTRQEEEQQQPPPDRRPGEAEPQP